MGSGVYLDGPHHPVGELQSRHGCGRAEGGGAALEAAHYTAVLPVLLDGEPDQVPESLDWTEHRSSSGVSQGRGAQSQRECVSTHLVEPGSEKVLHRPTVR